MKPNTYELWQKFYKLDEEITDLTNRRNALLESSDEVKEYVRLEAMRDCALIEISDVNDKLKGVNHVKT